MVIELIYNWGVVDYEKGNVYGYIVIGVDDIYVICDIIKVVGGIVICELGLVKGGIIYIVFVKDFDGYMIEFI